MSKKTIRCAIYTRKSNEEGLEQNFNSLDAQRESCEAYIKSQVHEGWKIISKHYDDGGFSGGNMQRPAFQELLNDIKQDKIDIVVVYKVDRLTRSLMDFSKIVEIFDKHKTSFVSITQHFNTTTSMGRLTLNILLSFAQFEREVTGERIRDKFAASAKKGLWITGATPLGYKKQDGNLVEDTEHSWKIKTIFQKYLELGSVTKLKIYLDDNQISTRSGKQFSKGNLYHILSNQVYIGKIVKNKDIYDGQHLGIISVKEYDSVQKLLSKNCIYDSSKIKKSTNAMLQGKLFDENGNYFSPTRSTGRAGKIYNYYINQGFKQGKLKTNECLTRISAEKIENFIESKILENFSDKRIIQRILKNKSIDEQRYFLDRTSNLDLNKSTIRAILNKVIIKTNSVSINLSKNKIYNLITGEINSEIDENIEFSYDVQINKCCLNGNSILVGKENNYNQILINAIVKSFYYNKQILEGKLSSELNTRHARRLRNLRFLPPNVIEQIMSGTQPSDLTIEKLYAMCI